jgi:hypothetical protein
MRRAGFWLLALAGLLVCLFWPARGTDVSELQPAQLLLVERRDGRVRVACDSGARGVGDDLEAALGDMERTARGRLYLGTVDWVLFAPGAEKLIPAAAASARLRPAANVCLVTRAPEKLSDALAYLRTHPGEDTLARERAARLGGPPAAAPILSVREERMELLRGVDG